MKNIMFLAIAIIVLTHLASGQQTTDNPVSHEKDRMLILKNGDYYTGKLLAVLHEGVIFDPNIEQNFENLAPKFYPYESILHIREMDGKTYTVKMLESIAKTSIKDYELSFEKEQPAEKKIHYFFANFEMGPSDNDLETKIVNTTTGKMTFNFDKCIIDWSLDVNYLITDFWAAGLRFGQKYNSIYYTFDLWDEPIVSPYSPDFIKLSKVVITAPISAGFTLRKRINNFVLYGNLFYGPAHVVELDEKGNRISKASGKEFSYSAGIDYLLCSKWSLGLSANKYKYDIEYDLTQKEIMNCKQLTCKGIRASIKHYFNW